MQRVLNAKQVTMYVSPSADHRRFLVLVERDVSGSKAVAAGNLILPPRASQLAGGAHPHTEEVYYCVSGTGTLRLDDDDYPLESGSAAYVAPGVFHQLFNSGDEDLVMVWFESPPSSDVGKYVPMEKGWQQLPPEQ